MILAYHGQSLISWIIRIECWSSVSHVSHLLSDGTEIEAWNGGVQHNKSWGILHSEGTIVDVYDFVPKYQPEPSQILKLESFLIEQVGKGYDYAGLFRFLPLVRLFIRASNPNRYFCSELEMDAHDMAGIPLLTSDPLKTTPAQVISSPMLYKRATWIVGEPLPIAGRPDFSKFAPQLS